MSGKTELQIFEDSPPQMAAESAVFQDVHPTTALDGTSEKIEFVIQGSDTEYLDLNDTLLSLRVQLCKQDGTKFVAADADQPVPSNYFMNALFSNVTLTLNDTHIEGGSEIYPYKATIESIFNFSEDAKRIQLLPAGYSDEEDERKKWGKDSVEFELVGSLRLDFFNQPRYLIPGVSVRIVLTRTKDHFALHLPKNTAMDPKFAFKTKLTSALLYVRRVKVTPFVEKGHSHGFKTKNAIYPYSRTKTVMFSVPTGTTSFFKENLFSTALLPKFIIVGMVHGNAYGGALDQEPFKFQHFNVSHISLHRDGQSIPYKRAYNPVFPNQAAGQQTKLFADVYVRSMLQNTQILNNNTSNGVEYKDFYENGYTFFTFNLAPDFDFIQTQVPRDANLRLDMQFGQALTHPINVIAYAIYDAKLQITRDRNIILDACV
jgi:hypothetical protein